MKCKSWLITQNVIKNRLLYQFERRRTYTFCERDRSDLSESNYLLLMSWPRFRFHRDGSMERVAVYVRLLQIAHHNSTSCRVSALRNCLELISPDSRQSGKFRNYSGYFFFFTRGKRAPRR